MLRNRVVLAALGVLAFRSLAGAAPVTLATAGKATATIVLPAAANDREKLAAGDLQHYVKAICGVELPLATDGKRVAGAGLYIGACEPTRPEDFPPKTLNPEAYAIHARDGSVFFTGRYPTPTYFAVAAFLETNLGVRWFAPGDEWEYVPAGKPGELKVEVRDVVSVPSTSPRIWSGHGWNPDWQTWNLRNKAVLGEVVPRRQFQNNVYRAFPIATYGQTHPEYYPLIDGKRWVPPGDDALYWRPCESNPEVQRLVVEYARKWFDEHPDIDSFSVGMDDVSHMCGCPNCRAWDPHPDSYEKHEFSDRHYKFVNAIARELAKTHPDRYVGTLIYSIARELPETVDKLEDNVFGFITEESASWWQPEVRAADHELTRQWARRCKHLSRYDYFGMGGITPRVYPHAMAEQLKFDKSLGLEGMYVEVYTFLPNTAPMIWAFARLQWDSRQNVDALLGEFYNRMFGPAAPTAKRYFDLLEKSWNTARPGRAGTWVHRNLKAQALAMSPEDVDEGFRLLRQASREAATDLQRSRLETLRATLEYGSFPIRAFALSGRLMNAPVTDERGATATMETVKQLGRLAQKREACWAAAAKRDDLLGETVRGLGDMGYLVLGQMPELEGGATAAALRVMGWYAAHDPGKLDQLAAQVEALPASPLADALNGWLWVLREKPASLAKNGDFEAAGTSQEPPKADWKVADAPPGWRTWCRDSGALEVRPGAGRSGSTAASISGASGACYLQDVPVKAGEKYLAVVWVKTDPPAGQGGARFTLRYQAVGGGWYAGRALEPSVSLPAGVKDFQPLILAVTVPEGAGAIVLMPGVEGQERGASALFDDVALYRLP